MSRWARKGFPPCNEPFSNPAGHTHAPTHTLRGLDPQMPHANGQGRYMPDTCTATCRYATSPVSSCMYVPGGNNYERICKYNSTHQPQAFWWLFVPRVCLPGVMLPLIVVKIFSSSSAQRASGTSIVAVALGRGSHCWQ